MNHALKRTINFDNVYWKKDKNGKRKPKVYFSLYSWRAASITAASMFDMGDDRIQALSGHATISEISVYRRNRLNLERTQRAREKFSQALQNFQIPSSYTGVQYKPNYLNDEDDEKEGNQGNDKEEADTDEEEDDDNEQEDEEEDEEEDDDYEENDDEEEDDEDEYDDDDQDEGDNDSEQEGEDSEQEGEDSEQEGGDSEQEGKDDEEGNEMDVDSDEDNDEDESNNHGMDYMGHNNNDNDNDNKNNTNHHNIGDINGNIVTPSEISLYFERNSHLSQSSAMKRNTSINWVSSQLDYNVLTQETDGTSITAIPGRVEFPFHKTDLKANFEISQLSPIQESHRKLI